MTATMNERLQQLRVLPVIVIDSAGDAVPLARALLAGGLPGAEVTLRTKAAVEALRRIAGECPDVLAGAGTVLTPKQVDDARDAGAKFIVAPGFNARVVARAREVELPVYPGIATPTEIEMALEHGVEVVKFFPAEPMGGVKFLRAIAAPYAGVQFMPTGGVSAENVREYLAFDRVLACGGSWMAPADRLKARDFDWIRDQAAKVSALVGTTPSVTPARADVPRRST